MDVKLPMNDRLRVAVVSLGHPDLSPGGAEYASHALFTHLKGRHDSEAVFVAWAEPAALGHGGAFGAFRGRPDELLWSTPPLDFFRLMNTAPEALRDQALELFSHIAPDVVHLHHYFHFGVDLFRLLKEDLDLPLIVTLHEFLAICHNHGQMVKTDGRLCHISSPAECAACFPSDSSAKFFARRDLILDHFACVDMFISPSRFLAQRYVDWGIDAERIRVIENPLHPRRAAGRTHRLPAQPSQAIRLGYFGRYTPQKGVDVLLDAIAMLPPEIRQRVKLTLHGLNLRQQDERTRQRISGKIDALKDSVTNFGPYENDQAMALMQAVDWVVVPSTWWENSPVVIQEALEAGVPVLASNIGGMREKVRDGVDGAHFMAGSSVDLAGKIAAIVTGTLGADVPPARSDRNGAVEQIMQCYRAVTAGDSVAPVAAVLGQ